MITREVLLAVAELVERAAKTAHEANRKYCQDLGDNTQVPWEEAPEWQKKSARMGVFEVAMGATPEKLHEAWSKVKRADGWEYGPVKNAEKKQHPCLVSYENLPEHQRKKDSIFHDTVTVCLAWVKNAEQLDHQLALEAMAKADKFLPA